MRKSWAWNERRANLFALEAEAVRGNLVRVWTFAFISAVHTHFKTHHHKMSANMNNLAKFYYLQYERALELFETDRQSALDLLTGLTLDPHLTLWYRLQNRSCLANQLDDLDSAHEHLAAAERAYAEIVRG